MKRRPAEPGLAWWLVDVLSRTLDPGECEAVRGDLEESGERGSDALRGVMGLVARRQIALWADWRPWLVLLGVIVPLGLLLSLASKRTADVSAVYIWLYTSGLDWNLVRDGGYWYAMWDSFPNILLPWFALACWSWAGAFLLASLSRRIARFSGVLLCLVVVLAGALGAPQHFDDWFRMNHGRSYNGNAPVFALVFYRILFPLIVQAVFVLLPALSGMRRGLRLGAGHHVYKAALWACGLISVLTLLADTSAWWQLGIGTSFPLRYLRVPSPVPCALAGPVGYLLATAVLRWRERRRLSLA